MHAANYSSFREVSDIADLKDAKVYSKSGARKRGRTRCSAPSVEPKTRTG